MRWRVHAHGSSAAIGEWQVDTTAASGPYIAVLLSSNAFDATCFVEPGGRVNGVGTESPSQAERILPASGVAPSSWGFTRAANKQGFSYASGRVGAGVSAVTLVLSNGEHVRASVEDGWFLALWPATPGQPSSLEVTTAHGTRDRNLNLPPAVAREEA